jgi:hypothetical protein
MGSVVVLGLLERGIVGGPFPSVRPVRAKARAWFGAGKLLRQKSKEDRG